MNKFVVTALLSAGIAGAALFLGGLKGAGPADTPPPATLDIVSPTLESFDPIGSDKSSEVAALSLLHARLLSFDAKSNTLVPDLASSHEHSPDNRTWTFSLREARTPDGLRAEAEDVVFSLRLVLNPALQSSLRTSLIFGGKPVEARAIDSHTVVISAAASAPYLDWILASVPILPRHAFETIAAGGDSWRQALGPAAKLEHLRGFGPFQIAAKSSKEIVFERNPGFGRRDESGRTLPLLGAIRFTLVDDVAAAKVLFDSDDRFVFRYTDPLEVGQYEGNPDFQVHELGIDGSTMFAWLNQGAQAKGVAPGKLALYRNVAFRRAVARAINRDEIVNAAFAGHASPLYGPVSEAYPWAAPAERLRPFTPAADFALARAELAAIDVLDSDGDGWLDYNESGTRHPLRIRLYTTPSPGEVRKVSAGVLAEQLRRLGIQVDVEVMEFNEVVKRIMSTFDYEMLLMFLEGSAHPSTERGMYGSDGRMHFFAPGQAQPATPWEAAVDHLFDQFATGPDAGARRQAFEKLQETWVTNQPVFYLVTQIKTMVTRRDRLSGFATVGRAGNAVLDRPFIERVNVNRAP